MYPVKTIESQDAKKPTLCFGCLSSNRKLRPLGDYYNIFHQLIDDDTYLMQQSDILLCWECRGALRKAELFKEKVAHAQSILLDPTILPEPLTTFSVATCDSVCTLTMAMNQSSNYRHDIKFKPVKLEKEETTKEKIDLIEPVEKKDNYFVNEPIDDNEWDAERLDDNWISDDSDRILEVMLKTRQQKNKNHKNRHDNRDEKGVIDGEDDATKHEPKRKKKKEEEDPDYTPSKKEEKKNKNKIKEFATPINIKNSDTVVVTKNNKRPDFSEHCHLVGKQDYREFAKHTNIIRIDPNEISYWMERDRNSELFRSMKYKCEKCVDTFTELKLKKHNAFHVKNSKRNLVCKVCKQTYRDGAAKMIHQAKHGYIRECLLCGIKICSRNLMAQHLKRHSIRVQCTDCRETFGTKADFQKHYRTTHSTCVCDYCGAKLKHKQRMARHITTVHGFNHYCKLCNKSFKNYDRHMKIRHTTDQAEAAFCVECNIRFLNIYAYKHHLLVSAAHRRDKHIEREYPCPDCDKVYRSRSALRDHHDWVHKGTSRHQCKQCPRSFQTPTQLRVHTRSVHLGLKAAKNKICNICGRGFSVNKILIHHMRTHTGERPHVCEHCGAGFAQKIAMLTHVKKQHGGAILQTDSINEYSDYSKHAG